MSSILIIAGALGLMVVAGGYQLWTARLSGPDAKRTQLMSTESATFTRSDLEDPSAILSDRAKLRNGLVALLEVTTIVMAVWMTIEVYSTPGITLGYELLITGALVVGAMLVGRGLYLRLGLYSPVTVQESLRSTVGADVANDFAALGGIAETARGDATLDEATVGLLAAAKNGESFDSVVEWGESEAVAEAETFEERVGTLTEAGILVREDGHIEVGPQLADVEDDQLVTMTATVLN